MVTTLETASSSPFQTSFFAFAVFIYEQNNCFILLLFSIYICLLSRGPGMRVISACLGISLAQWSGFLFSPFSFHVLLLELCRKCPPGRAPGPPFLYPWCCSWSNVGMHWARWYSQTVAITALLSVCPGGQFPVNRFGVAWTQSAGRLCHTFRSKSARSPDWGFRTVWSYSLLSRSIQLITNVVGSQHQEALPSAEHPWDACPLLLERSGYFYQAITFFYDVMLRATKVSQ